MSKQKRQRFIFGIIFVLGLLVLLFPFVSQLVYYRASRVTIEEFDETVATIDESEKQERLFLAHAYNEVLRENAQGGREIVYEDPFTQADKDAGLAHYAQMLEVNEQIGYVDIPKINEKLPVYAGTSEQVLQKGAGHIEGTSLPVGGESTHAVITAHRGLPTARLFTDLDKVEIGDEFYVTNLGETLAYRVDDIVVIEPHELSYLEVTAGEDYVTLLTCTPYMINSHRLLVRGHRVPYEVGREEVARETNRLWIYVLIFVLILLIILLIWFIRRKRRNKES